MLNRVFYFHLFLEILSVLVSSKSETPSFIKETVRIAFDSLSYSAAMFVNGIVLGSQPYNYWYITDYTQVGLAGFSLSFFLKG